MQSFFSNKNINYLSPQLYTSGTETSNDYTTAAGVQWSSYAKASAQIVPSIVTGSLYPSAKSYFSGVGVTTGGYVQWSQTVTSGSGSSPSSPPSSGSGSTTRCGVNWSAANTGCGNACTTNSNCPSGQGCYANLAACSSHASSDPSDKILGDTTPVVPGTTLTSLQIGLIVGGCCIVVAIVVIVAVVLQKKKEERV